MRSISSHWRHRLCKEDLDAHNFKLPEIVEIAERQLMKSEKLQQIRLLFRNEPDALRVLELLGSGYSSQEIQARLNIPPEHLRSIIGRIRRRLVIEKERWDL